MLNFRSVNERFMGIASMPQVLGSFFALKEIHQPQDIASQSSLTSCRFVSSQHHIGTG